MDRATHQQHSNILGSVAIVASAVVLWPWQRSLLFAGAGYIGTWITFALARAGASRIDLALVQPDSVGKLETSLFGGRLPSSVMQKALYQEQAIQPYDIAALAIHASFFVVPTSVALVLLATSREQFLHYWRATLATLALASIGILLAPTAPPWLHDPSHVSRVITALSQGNGVPLTSAGVDSNSQRLSFDPNSLAALPSVHVAAAVLVCFACWRRRSRFRVLGLAYALAMSVSVIYLGEHYAIDVLAGWAVAAIGWLITGHTVAFHGRRDDSATTPAGVTPDSRLPARPGPG